MAPSSVQFPPSQRSQQSQNPKADQIVWRYFNKVVLSVANARIISPDSQDPRDALAPGLPVNDYEEGGGTPTGGISGAAPGPSSAVAGPKVDKWFNLETPDLDTFKPTLDIFKQISTTFPIAPVDIATDPPPLIIQVLLSIPQPSLNKVLVLNHGDNRTRVDPTPRYILLESWRVEITRRIPKNHETASSTSSSSSFSSSSISSLYDVELPTVYKQSVALFRSVYTLLRVLPTWKLYRRLRRKRTGPGSGMTLELRVEVPSQSALSSAASSVVDLPLVVDSIPIIGFDTPLSQHRSANKVETRAFSSIPSPLGELNLSLKYRVETNFSLESLESLLSTGLVSTDIQTDLFAPTELFPASPNPPPNYPKPQYQPISGAAPPPGRKDEAGPSRQPPPPAADDEFDFVSDFTSTVVAEQQRIRRDSQTARLAAAGPPIGTSSSGGRNLGTGNLLQGSRSGLPLKQSPRSLPGSLPREPLLGGTSPLPGSAGPTYAVGQPASAVPPRSRYDSTPHSSSPPSNNTNSPRGLAQQPLHRPNPNALTPTQPFPRQQLPPEGQPLHSRTTSTPGGTARPPPVPLPVTGVSPAPLSSLARMLSREDLPFAAPSTNASGSGGTLIRRGRKESTSALSSTSSPGGGGASPARPVFTYSPRSRMTPLPSPAPPFGRRESAQLTPPNAVGPVPLPTAGGPRRPSLDAIAPFKSSTLSSSPSSLGAGRINSPIGERITSSFLHPGAASRQLVAGGGTGSSDSPRSPIPMARRQAGALGTADSSPYSNPHGSPSPAPQGDLSSKGLSGSSMESAGVGGVTPRRLSGHATQSPELAGAGLPVPPKRYSSSFTHRYRDSTSTTGSAALVTGAGGVSGSVGSGSGAGGNSLGLAGVGVGEPRRLDTLYSDASTDDGDIEALVKAIESRPQPRGGTPPISRLSVSPASHPSIGSLPRTQTSHLASPAHPASDHDRQERFLAKQLATINHVPVVATEEVVDLLQALGRAAPQAVRNKHKIYSILRVAHDTCSYVVETGNPPEGQKDAGFKQLLDRMEKYCIVLDALEEILLEFAGILPSEITVFGPEMYSSWLQSRSIFGRILDKLCHPPFPTISYKTQDIAEDSFFDDCSWLSRLLYSGIDAEIAAQFPDPSVAHPALAVTKGLHYLVSQIKYGTQSEETRELILDIATLLAQTLAAASPNHDGELRQREPSPPTAAGRDWLIQALADSLSILDLETALETSKAQELASKWTGIKASFTSQGLSAREQ